MEAAPLDFHRRWALLVTILTLVLDQILAMDLEFVCPVQPLDRESLAMILTTALDLTPAMDLEYATTLT